MRTVVIIGVLAAIIGLGGCGPATGSASGDLSTAISAGTAPYALLDLQTRTITYAVDVPDLGSNAAYRDEIMVFHRTGPEGARFLAGVFEVTQAQWARFGSGSPWLGIDTQVVAAAAHAGDKPAYGIDYDSLVVDLAAFSLSGGGHLTVPTSTQWGQMTGVSSGYTWGADFDRATLRGNALVHESAISESNRATRLVGGIDTGGPDAVGSRAASPTGFYDLHGNVWEWTSPGTEVRGGSWYDAASLSRVEVRAGSGQGMRYDVDHALVGARLVLIP
jgi:formylglycine-generating enzyme required for sulfatase activity